MEVARERPSPSAMASKVCSRYKSEMSLESSSSVSRLVDSTVDGWAGVRVGAWTSAPLDVVEPST